MTYRQTLDWMFAQLPMYQQKGKSAFNAKLDNTLAFAAHLDHPEKKFKSIHVGGTNGKGSSSHMLASVLQEAGYKTGLYTSPHLKDFRERIRIDGKMVSEKFVVDFIQTNQSFFEEHRLSFFEMTVGMAFTYFAEKMVDIAIVEVGLGGRLDSTNIIVPEVALITNIGLDHVDLLGDTLAKIAFEKAGIIKENIPIVISEYQNDTAEIFERVANSKTAKVIYAEKSLKKKYKTSLLGNYQKKNVNGVVAVLQELQGFEVREEHIVDGLLNVTQNTGLMGRWQMMRIEPKVVCDTAHNSEGLALVLQQVAQQDYDRLHIVLGFVKGKNLDAILPLFPKNAEYYFCRPDIPRGLDVEVLQQNAKAFGLKGKCFTSVGNAYNAALQNADVGDFIFIGGSTFTVAEVV
ncbi:bifunctional folylpolyglutamate synthase/dihydrofolate synthase [Pricia antarctica]|nr:folylpolyglutamate synthase/dihydrofolate synthase family protein [Pricia antarctica]